MGSDSPTPSRMGADPTTHCSFCLLAEFDIDKGATLSHQYPEPTGHDDHLLAELMLPDGAHARAEDWTIFFLKSHPKTESTSRKSIEGMSDTNYSGTGVDEEATEDLTYVINLVRTKHDTSVRRGALVKALAIGTKYPYIQMFKPVLLLALDDYFTNPNVECLVRLYEAINNLDLSGMPEFTREEKLILRASDRRDMFEERFHLRSSEEDEDGSKNDLSGADGPDFAYSADEHDPNRPRAGSGSTLSETDSRSMRRRPSQIDVLPNGMSRRPSGANSIDRRPSGPISPLPSSGRPRDTHFFDTRIVYRSIPIPIRLPLTTFTEEVGEYSLIKLVQTFSSPASTPTGPQHPHLHTNGPLTHPIILLFNALATQKRVVFLGHGQPAHQVASYVLAACALGSGCGVVFRGFTSRAFPYTNLTNLDELEKVPGYVAGVTNPRFEDLHAWDVLCNIENGKVIVAKDIAPAPPLQPRPAMTRDTFSSNSLTSQAGSAGIGHDASRAPSEVETGTKAVAGGGRERSGTMIETRQDAPDNMFMEDILGAINAHYGEKYIRARFTDYALRFARIAARHEEHFYGSTAIGAPSQPYLNGQLGSGAVFPDRDTEMREIHNNAMRAEGWRASKSFRYYCQDEASRERNQAIRGFDVSHQISRLKRARSLALGESDHIYEAIARSVRSSEQIIELLSMLPPHAGGLLPLGFGLFHPSSSIRNAIVDFFLHLCTHPVGKKFVQSLNTFHRLAFARLCHERNEAIRERHRDSISAGSGLAGANTSGAQSPGGGHIAPSLGQAADASASANFPIPLTLPRTSQGYALAAQAQLGLPMPGGTMSRTPSSSSVNPS